MLAYLNLMRPQLFFLADGALRLEYFSPWVAIGLFAGLGGIIVLLGIKSLAGLGAARKWVAIAMRLAVLLLVILILGDIKWVRRNTDLDLMIVRDISRSTELVHDFPGKFLQTSIDDYLLQLVSGDRSPSRKPSDKVGEISFNERSYIDAIPSEKLSLEARAVRGPGTGTDAAAAIQLGLASMSGDSSHRMLLIWDGNATAGDLNAALAAAASQHVPIDVMPLKYNVEHEVMMDNFIAPNARQEGQPFTIEVHLQNKNDTTVEGNLSVTDNGNLMALRDGKTTERISLKPGPNVHRLQVPPQTEGVHQFKATISDVSNVSAAVGGKPEPAASQLDNKSAQTFTFVNGKGMVLFVDNTDPEHQVDSGKFLREALLAEKINLVSISPEQFPNNPIDLQGYQAVILANVPRGTGGLSDEQEHMLASYVHDTGGGLLMIGGPQTFGAGGWEGSHLEQELPVTMEIPAQRQIPKGALVLAMDPAEAADGNYWGSQCAIKAMEALSSLDEVGVISYGWANGPAGCRWDAPLSPKGDGSKVLAAIKNWQLGDLPSFDEAVNLAIHGDGSSPGLIQSDAKAKHIIIITDDDPQPPSDATIQVCIDNKISISTVTVCPHTPGNVAPKMREIAKATGGRSYGPVEPNGMATVPQIFIKEATVVKRTIVQEYRDGVALNLAPSPSDMLKGIPPGPLPALYGMDLTGRRDNPLVEAPITAGPKHDPVLAFWQAGLGKSAVFTGDAFNRWDANWVGTPMYEKFWSQLVRGISRSPISSDFETDMAVDGSKGHITVHALKEDDAFNNFLMVQGTIAGGDDLTPHPVRLVQTGPGTYEADFDASAQGNYICALQYSGQNGKSGMLRAGTVVNSSPELRDLQSNDLILQQIAERTGGRVLAPFDAASPDLFSRDGLVVSESPKSIWDLLLPVLLALVLIDVAVRRIAWDYAAMRRMALASAAYVRQFTVTYQKVDNRQTLDSLKRVRDEVAEQKFRPAAPVVSSDSTVPVEGESLPDPRAKFNAGEGVAGDLSAVVGGAANIPLRSGAKLGEPKGAPGAGEHTGGLLAAKRRAQQKIKQQEQNIE
ncbi:MAG: hypothetical protein M3O30_06900 [Planctomycetota bacterium]|nr:hypothetical protein [Planctomycetota bacterium]